MSKYYDGTKLLSLLDKNKKKPEIYISTSIRGEGKTTYFNRLVINKWIKRKEEFFLIYRYKYELSEVGKKFFSNIQELYFPDYLIKTKKRCGGIYVEIMLKPPKEDKYFTVGYAGALNSAEQLKKYSHVFENVTSMIFDEFQSESNNYCDNEIDKFQSLHSTIARGKGQRNRYVPVYMLSNLISLINPYYVVMNITQLLQPETKFLRGNGWVLEQTCSLENIQSLSNSTFNNIFESTSYNKSLKEIYYLNDNNNMIENIKGNNRYFATIYNNNKIFSIKYFPDDKILYCDKRIDNQFKYKLACTEDDMKPDRRLLKSEKSFLNTMIRFYNKGYFRFKDLECKDTLIKIISYH